LDLVTIYPNVYYKYYYIYLYSTSSQVAVQLRNDAANALKQLRDVEQISFQFLNTISEMSGARSSMGTLFQTRGSWTAK